MDRFRLLLVSFESRLQDILSRGIDTELLNCDSNRYLDRLLSFSHDGINKLAVLSTRKGAQVVLILIHCKSNFDMILYNKIFFHIVNASLIKLSVSGMKRLLIITELLHYAPPERKYSLVQCSVWLL